MTGDRQDPGSHAQKFQAKDLQEKLRAEWGRVGLHFLLQNELVAGWPGLRVGPMRLPRALVAIALILAPLTHASVGFD